MLTTIEYLSKPQQERLTALIQQIVRAVQPEKVICFGIRVSQYQEWGCFLDNGGYKDNVYPSFDLLLISPTEEKRAEHEISQIAEQKCQSPLAISCITHKIHAVNDALTFGNPFFCSLYHKGILLYDAGSVPLSDPGNPEEAALKKYIAEAYWSRWYGLAQQFLKGAADSLPYGRPALTVFMLHQAVEHTCIALIRVFTGYRPNTHNLFRLLTIIENFSAMLMCVFPCITKEEKELFKILQKAYSDSRYKDVYDISADKVAVLTERVKELQAIAESLYMERIASYSESQQPHLPLVANDAK
jgi:HEPN domain-containing protein